MAAGPGREWEGGYPRGRESQLPLPAALPFPHVRDGRRTPHRIANDTRKSCFYTTTRRSCVKILDVLLEIIQLYGVLLIEMVASVVI